MKTPSISEKAVGPFVEKIEKLSRLQRILIYAGTFLILIGGFVWLFYLPKNEKIEKLTKQVDSLSKKLEQAKRNAAQIEKIRAQFKQAQVRFEEAKTKLPEKEEIPSLLTSITAEGRDVGLKFLLFEPKKEVQREFYVDIPVAINVNGGYHDVGAFFDRVANLSRIVNIKNIRMAPVGGGKLETSCTAVTYKFRQEQPDKKKGKPKRKRRRN